MKNELEQLLHFRHYYLKRLCVVVEEMKRNAEKDEAAFSIQPGSVDDGDIEVVFRLESPICSVVFRLQHYTTRTHGKRVGAIKEPDPHKGLGCTDGLPGAYVLFNAG